MGCVQLKEFIVVLANTQISFSIIIYKGIFVLLSLLNFTELMVLKRTKAPVPFGYVYPSVVGWKGLSLMPLYGRFRKRYYEAIRLLLL